MSRLEIQSLSHDVLQDVGFAAGPGMFLCVIGPNGAGKSTLLRLLAGLDRPAAGRIVLDGRLLEDWPPHLLARHRSYLPQRPACDWPIPTRFLVELGLIPTLPAFGGLSPADTARVATALRDFDLAERADQPATTLSGGELARAMLARTMVGEPDVLILDEAFAGLDPRHALQAAARLAAYAASGHLVIAALHELDLAARFATHVLGLRAGRLHAAGPTGQVLTEPMLEGLFDTPAALTATRHGTAISFGS